MNRNDVMDNVSMKNGFDLNIENYTIDDLLEIYKIPKDQKGNITDSYVIKITTEIIQEYKNYNKEIVSEHTDEYIKFFNEAQTRIIQYLQSGMAFINDYAHTTAHAHAFSGSIPGVLSTPDNIIRNTQLNNPPTGELSTILQEYTKGVINPVERRTLKRVISIDTLFRANHANTKSVDFIWNLPTPINNVLSMKVISLEIPNMVKLFSNNKKNNIFTVHLYNVRQNYIDVDDVARTVYINHTETVIVPEGFYLADDFTELMNNYFVNSLPPTSGTVVRDGNGDLLTTPYDASLNQLKFNGLKFMLLEINKITSRTIIRAREETDQANPDEGVVVLRPYMGNSLTNAQYSPEFSFKLDFNIDDNKSFTDYYKEGGIFVRKITTQDVIVNGQPVTVMVDPDPSGNECKNSSMTRTHMTSKTLQCFRPKLDPMTGQITRSNTKLRPLYKNAGWAMGFFKDVYEPTPYVAQYVVNNQETYQPVTYRKYVASESSFGSTATQYFFLEIDDYNRNFTTNTIIAETGSGTHLGNNIVARIPITITSLNINHTNPSDMIFKQRDYFGPVKIEKLHLRLVDRYGETLDIQNNDYSVAIELTTTY